MYYAFISYSSFYNDISTYFFYNFYDMLFRVLYVLMICLRWQQGYVEATYKDPGRR